MIGGKFLKLSPSISISKVTTADVASEGEGNDDYEEKEVDEGDNSRVLSLVILIFVFMAS